MIYLLEDDSSIRELVTYTLNSVGLEATGFETPADFWKAMAKQRPNLVLLDIMLPEEDGISILKKLRRSAATEKIPVMMITAKGTEYDKVLGLDSGADDYLVKPFDVQEVLLRIRVLLRRNQPQVESMTSSEILEAGEIEILPDTLEAVILNKKMKLTPTEFEILYCLMQHFNKAVTLATLLEEVWGYSSDEDVRMLRVHVGALRNKIEPDSKNPKYLHTVTNVGYKLTPFGE